MKYGAQPPPDPGASLPAEIILHLARPHLLPFFSALYMDLRESARTLMRTMLATSLAGPRANGKRAMDKGVLSTLIHT